MSVWKMKLPETTLINTNCSPHESKWGESPPVNLNEARTVHLLPAAAAVVMWDVPPSVWAHLTGSALVCLAQCFSVVDLCLCVNILGEVVWTSLFEERLCSKHPNCCLHGWKHKLQKLVISAFTTVSGAGHHGKPFIGITRWKKEECGTPGAICPSGLLDMN